MSEYGNNTPQQGGEVPGKGAATGSLVCGIIAVVFWFVGIATAYGALVSVILGIVGLVLSANAKKAGFQGGMQTAGFVLSLLGLIFGAIIFVSCLAIVGCVLALS